MVIDLKDVDFPRQRRNEVERGNQLGLDVPSNVSPVEEGKVPKSKKGGHAVCIVGKIFRLFRYSSCEWVAGQSNVGWGPDCLLVGGHAGHP